MDWGKLLDPASLLGLALPSAIGAVIIVILYFLRRVLYHYIHKLTAKTKTCFDDILIQQTRIPVLLWCFWLGIFIGFTIYQAPPSWSVLTDELIPVLFVALGIYTGIMIIVATLKWYKVEVCPRTKSSLDDIIMSALIFGTPVIGGALGIIQVLNMLGKKNDTVNDWIGKNLPTLAFLVILMVTILLLSVIIIPRIVRTIIRNSQDVSTEEELKKREDTLSGVIGTSFQIIVIFIFALMIILQFVDWTVIVPVLTATGVAGVALGFGAQWLVKDIIAGLFIILEDQYRKGDVVKVADVSGVVEDITLRRTVLRDMDGIIHSVPNGEIRVASNFTKQWSRANLNISVSYDTDLDKAIAVINRVGKELAEDPLWVSAIITPPRALRVDKLGDSGIEIKVIGDTKPIRQWDVMGELRLRLKKAFDKEGIEIPWPHTKVYFGNMPPQITPKESQTPRNEKEIPKKPD
jgi:moderate conductance mechanosensitive channel